jgi:hypothetical protein
MRFPSIDVFSNIDGIIDEIYKQLPEESPQTPFEKGEKEKESVTTKMEKL